ncbi:MAG: hypothetical protein GQ570_03860 [Helicobacteraceae bacterium]|nr:hypothetical protein [Helicobacteraceae bacterium]
MTKLVKNTVVSLGLAACEGDDAQALLASSIESATYIIAGILRTSLDAQVGNINLYDIKEYSSLMYGGTPLVLKLTNGFINTATNALVVETSPSWENATWTVIPVEGYILEKEKGHVKILNDLSIEVRFIRVTYDSGFAAKGDAPGKAYTGVPEWAIQATKLLAVHMYSVTLRAKNSAKTTGAVGLTEVPPAVNIMLEGHHRLLSGSLSPV